MGNEKEELLFALVPPSTITIHQFLGTHIIAYLIIDFNSFL